MKNYKIQNTNYKQITNKIAAKAREETLRAAESQTINSKGGHGLHKDSFRLQTMTAFNKKFLQGGPGGTVFSKRDPPGRRRHKEQMNEAKRFF